MKRLDLWLGKNLFQPPVIILCQMTGLTQFAVYRYLWLAVVYYWIWMLDADDHWLIKTVLLIIGAFWTISAGMAPDEPLKPSHWVRRLLVIMALLDSVLGALLDEFPNITWLGVLLAEYALTIKIVPPGETKRLSTIGRKVEA